MTHKSGCNITDHFDGLHDGFLLCYFYQRVISNDWLDAWNDQLVVLINLFCEYFMACKWQGCRKCTKQLITFSSV